jgi:hypothetical protein
LGTFALRRWGRFPDLQDALEARRSVMALFKNTEIRRAGEVIRGDVEVDVSVPITGPSAGQIEWSGVLRPPNNTGLARGETYMLVLPGYVPAKIQITDEANAVDGSVPFKGREPLISEPKKVQHTE